MYMYIYIYIVTRKVLLRLNGLKSTLKCLGKNIFLSFFFRKWGFMQRIYIYIYRDYRVPCFQAPNSAGTITNFDWISLFHQKRTQFTEYSKNFRLTSDKGCKRCCKGEKVTRGTQSWLGRFPFRCQQAAYAPSEFMWFGFNGFSN